MIARLSWRLAVSWSILALGCGSGMKVQTNAMPDLGPALQSYRTYAWLPLRPEDDEAHNPALVAQLHESVDRELAAKGYRRVDSGEADFRVGWHVSLKHTAEVDTLNPYYGYVWDPAYFGPPGVTRAEVPLGVTDTRVREYKKGTLVLDVVDARSQKLVWRGSAEADVPESVKDRAKKIDEGAKKVLEAFPRAS